MSFRIRNEMAEATRLTRAGRLQEATALMQRMLTARNSPEASSAEGGPVIDGTFTDHTAQSVPRPLKGLSETIAELTQRAKTSWSRPGLEKPGTSLPPLPEGASFTAHGFSGAAGTRMYKLYVPSRRVDRAPALVVMLHGCTQSADDFAVGTGMNALAEEHGVLVVYPDQPASANPNRCWNWFNPEDQRRDSGELSLIAGIARQIMAEHGVDPERVYVAGLSAGGAAAANLGAAYPDLFAAVGVHSGLPARAARDLPSAFAAMRQGVAPEPSGTRLSVPTIVFHGDQDATVHPRNGDAMAAPARVEAGGRSTRYQGRADGGLAFSRTVHSRSDGQPFCEQWLVHGAGHAWSGGQPAGSHTDARGPDASREMLRFFLAHGRRSRRRAGR